MESNTHGIPFSWFEKGIQYIVSDKNNNFFTGTFISGNARGNCIIKMGNNSTQSVPFDSIALVRLNSTNPLDYPSPFSSKGGKRKSKKSRKSRKSKKTRKSRK